MERRIMKVEGCVQIASYEILKTTYYKINKTDASNIKQLFKNLIQELQNFDSQELTQMLMSKIFTTEFQDCAM